MDREIGFSIAKAWREAKDDNNDAGSELRVRSIFVVSSVGGSAAR
jgi:hypothetical protein